MVRYKAIIAYDGTNFNGFQKQPNGRTVQEEVEKTLQKMANGKEITVFGSGRTDAGVHAIGQVIHFDYPEERPLERMRFALDTQSPEDIAVRQVEIVSEDFHARYLVKEKTYQFRVDIGKPRSPFRRHYASYFPYPLEADHFYHNLLFIFHFIQIKSFRVCCRSCCITIFFRNNIWDTIFRQSAIANFQKRSY